MRSCTKFTALFGGGVAGAVALGAMIAAPGCASLTDDATPSSAGTFDGSAAAPSGACTACVTQACAGVRAVCLTDDDCVALRGCSEQRESADARARCFCGGASARGESDGGGVSSLAAYNAFSACNDARTCGTSCASSCTSTCAAGASTTTAPPCDSDDPDASDAGRDGGADLDASSDANADASDADAADADAAPQAAAPSVDGCASCASDRCGDAEKACTFGSECSAFLACASVCTSAACADACATEHATGHVAATELSTCTLTSCRSACGL